MTAEQHYRALERMYLAAPINEIYRPRITVGKERAEIEIAVSESLFHSAGAVHGSVYSKMLDDAAFFAANSLEAEFFVLTVEFTTNMTRPISSGHMRSLGRVTGRSGRQIAAEATVTNEQGVEIGRGSGVFVRSRIPLVDALGYAEAGERD